jgi:multiple sugar transport system permease protein
MITTASLVSKAIQRRETKKVAKSLVYHLVVALFGFVMVYPLVWMFASSFKPADEVWRYATSLIPLKPTLDNYINGWQGFGGTTFATFFKNTVFYSVAGTIFQVGASAVVAYGFARVRFAGRNFWFWCMIGTLLLPNQVRAVPNYILFTKLGWLNSFKPLLIPRLGGNAFFIFMIMQFIRGIPVELDEAAEMDGCSKVGIFLRIILPLISPAMITAGIFSFYWTWSAFFEPVIYLTEPRLYTVSVALRAFSDPAGVTNWGEIFAMSILSLVPVFVVFVLFQRYLVRGISTTGLAGT